MSDFEKVYEEFIAGELSIKPVSALKKYRAGLSELESRLGLTAEQSEELKELILNIAGDYGREMFRAGFELAGETPAQPV